MDWLVEPLLLEPLPVRDPDPPVPRPGWLPPDPPADPPWLLEPRPRLPPGLVIVPVGVPLPIDAPSLGELIWLALGAEIPPEADPDPDPEPDAECSPEPDPEPESDANPEPRDPPWSALAVLGVTALL